MTSFTPLAVTLCALVFMSGFESYHKPEPPKPRPAFGKLTDPRFIAPAQFRQWIMRYAAEFGVPLDVATRLPFEESGWTQYLTVRNRNGTYDHDMFQLNSRYHHVMTTESNIREGLRYWAWCRKNTKSDYEATLAYICGLTGMSHPTLQAIREALAVSRGTM